MKIRSLVRRTMVAVTAAVLVGGIPVALAPQAVAADNGAWSATPCQKGQLTPRQFFFFELSEGQKIQDCIAVRNASDERLVLDVYPADAFNVESGAGFAVRKKDEKNADVGTWIDLKKQRVEVEPGGIARVGFSMAVPQGVTPGDHAGGIVTVEQAPTPDTSSGTSAVAIQRALGVRMYVRVPGPLTPALVVERVSVSARAARLPVIGDQGKAIVTYTVRNDGNTRMSPDRLITFTGLFGRTILTAPPGALPEILPGSRVTLSQEFEGMPVLDRLTVRVELNDPQTDTQAAGDEVVWVVSIAFLVVVSLLVVAMILTYRRWRSNNPRPGASNAADAEPSAAEAIQP